MSDRSSRPKKPPRQLRLFSPPFRPNREQRRLGLRRIAKIREQLERGRGAGKPDEGN